MIVNKMNVKMYSIVLKYLSNQHGDLEEPSLLNNLIVKTISLKFSRMDHYYALCLSYHSITESRSAATKHTLVGQKYFKEGGRQTYVWEEQNYIKYNKIYNNLENFRGLDCC